MLSKEDNKRITRVEPGTQTGVLMRRYWIPALLSSEIDKNHRKRRNKAVDWLIDRGVQKTESYSGIEGINTQDHAVQESMGPIIDRTRENLGTTDKAVIATRRILLRVLKELEQGLDPPGLGTSYYDLRAIERFVNSGMTWRNMLKDFVNSTVASELRHDIDAASV